MSVRRVTLLEKVGVQHPSLIYVSAGKPQLNQLMEGSTRCGSVPSNPFGGAEIEHGHVRSLFSMRYSCKNPD